MSYRLRECPLCGGRKFVPLLSARDYHYGNPGEYTQSQCIQCRLAFLDPMYDEQELAAFYPKNYYAFGDRFQVSHPDYSFRARIWRFLGLREFPTKDPKFERPGRMLDVGCGSGWFIFQMREAGWDVTGVEPNVAAANFGKSEKGLNIIPGSLLDVTFPAGSFDYVRMNHSFEHMEHPNPVLDEAYRILADNGKLMIGVPNRDSLNARVFGRYWHHLALPVHTFSYSVRTLSRMLRKHNFEVKKVVFNTNPTPLLESIEMYLNREDASLSFKGRLTVSVAATILGNCAAQLQNFFRVADMIEITAAKRQGTSEK
jgi:SAM-dependent methyltransferase